MTGFSAFTIIILNRNVQIEKQRWGHGYHGKGKSRYKDGCFIYEIRLMITEGDKKEHTVDAMVELLDKIGMEKDPN